MTKTRWALVVLAALVLLFLLVMCTPGNGAQAATPDAGTPSGPQSQTFTSNATPVLSRATGGAYCWVWSPTWYTNNSVGLRLMTYGLDVKWCSNLAQTKVVSLAYNFCHDAGHGAATYVDCSKDKGGLGYSSLGMQTYWHYKFWLPVTGDLKHYYPHVRFNLYANGGIDGTIWYW